VKFKDSKGKSTLKLCSYGQNLLPYVIDETKGTMDRTEINDAINSYIIELNERNAQNEVE
jgi:hypothetical protein